ncbi:MAG TPA: glycosyltransferase, partial [Acidimicrobiales bacterium]|nr:glycosyltransferase [Acidimicrobiales bacterium]
AFALGTRLVQSGHAVRLYGAPRFEPACAARGIELTPCRSVPPFPRDVDLTTVSREFLRPALNGAEVAKEIVGAAEESGAGALVVDCVMGAAFTAAQYLGLPTAVLVHVLFQPFAAWGKTIVDVGPSRAALGLSRLEVGHMSTLLEPTAVRLVTTLPELDVPGPTPAGTRYVGPVLEPGADEDWDSPFDPSDDRPLVLVSLSTTFQNQMDALGTILDALAGLPVRALLTLGGILTPESVAAPDNVAVAGFVPHAAVLPQAAIVVSHAGLSTIMTSLAYGVPLVCIPQGRDQGINAERVEAVGAGVCLAKEADAEAIARAIVRTLGARGYRDAAAGFESSITGLGRGARAAAEVEALLGA